MMKDGTGHVYLYTLCHDDSQIYKLRKCYNIFHKLTYEIPKNKLRNAKLLTLEESGN